MANYHLHIVTPDRLVYDGQAERMLVRTVNGDICIMAGHTDYAAPLAIGEARMTDAQGNVREAACNGGFVTVTAGEVYVAATTFEWADEIDVTRAERAREEAEHALQNATRGERPYVMAEAKMKRALARISAGAKK